MLSRRYLDFDRLSATLVALATVFASIVPVSAWCAADRATGVVVSEVAAGGAAAKAGLRPGDVIAQWRRADSGSASVEGAVAAPLDLEVAELEQAPRGPVELVILRDDESTAVALPPGAWRMTTRPQIDDDVEEAYRRGLEILADGRVDDAIATWDRITAADATPEIRCWLLRRSSRDLAAASDFEKAAERLDLLLDDPLHELTPSQRVIIALDKIDSLESSSRADDALALGRDLATMAEMELPGSLALAAVQRRVGAILFGARRIHEAGEAFEASREIFDRLAPDSLGAATAWNNVGSVAYMSGDVDGAYRGFKKALDIREHYPPDALTAGVLSNLGGIETNRGNLDRAEDLLRRAVDLLEHVVDDPRRLIRARVNLANVYLERGNSTAADAVYRDALRTARELGGMEAAEGAILNNLGTLSERRDDLEAASDFYSEALAVKRRLYPQSVDVAIGLRNLAEIERQRGNLNHAQELLENSLELSRQVASGGLEIARTQLTLSKVSWDQGKPDAARRQLAAAREVLESDFPASQELAAVESEAARQALGGADPQSARPHLERSIAITERFAPSSRRVAEALSDLARLARDRGDLAASQSYFDRAVAVVDDLARHNGGSQEVRSAFRAQYSSLYDDYESLLLDLGREREAFAVVEKSRARVLLTLLAQRDLVFSADIPDELDRTRRRLDLEYDRAIAHLATLDPADSEATDAARTDIESLRAERRRVRDEIRAASPRLAALTDPLPVDAEAALRELEPGTVALSYSVVADETRLYVLGPGPSDFAVHRLPIGRVEISNRVRTLNDAVSRGAGRRGRAALEVAAIALGDLVAPAKAALDRADHLLVIPDGALHWLPFAVLPDPGHPTQTLVERLPIRIESSFSTLAQLHQRSATAGRRTIVAFGDPVYPNNGLTERSDADRSAALTRLDLSPLPASRREIAALERLFSDQVSAHLGPQATESAVKALHGSYRAVHLACHAFVDPDRPLESGVVLSMPSPDTPSVAPDDNGILQAWEVFEQVRFDSDLVTLSACETALGGYVEGEGILGLTRAFQHAGASAVLASLWKVEDQSSADLMESFYRHLAAGDPRDEALQQAQVEALRGDPATGRPPAPASQWAAFQLYGE